MHRSPSSHPLFSTRPGSGSAASRSCSSCSRCIAGSRGSRAGLSERAGSKQGRPREESGSGTEIVACMGSLAPERVTELKEHANDVRQGIIRSLVAAGSGHSAGSLDMADVFTALYFHVMRHDPTRPEWPERDRLLLSCGHIAPVRYSAMAYAGYFPVEELLTLRKFGTRLQGHPERVSLKALETTSGPLGEGLAQGTGMALGAKLDHADWRVYVITSDAEHQCGLHMEAMMTAPKFKLDNLTCIIDRNFIQIDGSTEDIMPLEPLADKYRAFNWEVLECD